ncbi:Uncharacterised protein [Streptococcus pneumoniae]|nr:Uncharacterised protein [Streptococcus pneumoniae]
MDLKCPCLYLQLIHITYLISFQRSDNAQVQFAYGFLSSLRQYQPNQAKFHLLAAPHDQLKFLFQLKLPSHVPMHRSQDRRKHQQIALQTYLLRDDEATPQPLDYDMYCQYKQITLVSFKPTPIFDFLSFIITYIRIEQKKCEYTKGAFLLYFF